MQKKENIEYWKDEKAVNWHIRQFKEPYRITLAFSKFLKGHIKMDNICIMDLGCGAGGVHSIFSEYL